MLGWYHRLPTPVKSLAASARGYDLRTRRYSSKTNLMVEAALGRDRWTPDQWSVWQSARLRYVLERARARVPFYRDYWQTMPQDDSWQQLENWPILEKDTLRDNPIRFVADDCNTRRMYHEHTSGTTGKSLDLWWSNDTVREWYGLVEARSRRWYGVSRFDRWAILGGQLIVPAEQRTPPFWVWNSGLNQLYMSSYHLAPDLIPAFLDALKRYRVRYLWGYTSSLYALAQEALRQGRHDVRMTVAITNAEPVLDYQREAIREAFHCPVRETYGMAEIVSAAGECEAGAMHLWPEVGIVEVLEQGQPVEPGQVGNLVCTGLLNDDMPLIRYRVGDRGSALPSPSVCGCGRALPILSSLEGRADDLLFTPDGRRIGRLDPVFKAQIPVREAQIIQESLTKLRVRYIPAPGFTPQDGSQIVEELRARMGRIDVVLEEVESLPRTANGKFRAVICELSPEEKQALQAGSSPA